LLVFRRRDRGGPGDDVVIVANFRREPRQGCAIGFPARGTWKVRFHSDWSDHGDRFEGRDVGDVIAEPGQRDGRPCRGRISIPPYTAVILSQDRNEPMGPALRRRPHRRGRADGLPTRSDRIDSPAMQRPGRPPAARGALRLSVTRCACIVG
jgi:hypothetical protein